MGSAMKTVNINDARTHLSRHAAAMDTSASPGQRIGVAKGRFTAPGLDPDFDAKVAELFGDAIASSSA